MTNEQIKLQQIMNNPQYKNNPIVQNVMDLRNQGNRQGLIDLYKNVCQTTGNKPNEMFLR